MAATAVKSTMCHPPSGVKLPPRYSPDLRLMPGSLGPLRSTLPVSCTPDLSVTTATPSPRLMSSSTTRQYDAGTESSRFTTSSSATLHHQPAAVLPVRCDPHDPVLVDVRRRWPCAGRQRVLVDA